MKKPKPKSTKTKPEGAYPKLIKIIHSEEFAVHPYIRIRRLLMPGTKRKP